jgi:adenylate kinase
MINTNKEADVRLQIFNSFLNCPHRDTEEAKKIHEDMRQKDPLFYAKLACWYRKQPDQIRDHNEIFSAMLATDPYTDNREVGLALFRGQALFMKDKIVNFIKGKKVKIREKTGKKISVSNKKKIVDEVKIIEKKVGLGQSLPTALKTEIENFLSWVESDPDRLDAAAMKNQKALKNLYFAKGKHAFAHSDRAQKIVFEKSYPEDSRLQVYKKIAEAKTPEITAELIVKEKIPFSIAVGLIDQVTPSILIALINSMTPQEVINNIASLQEKGAMDNEDTKNLISSKLEKAKTTNVSALKSKSAVETGRVKNAEIVAQLDTVADIRVQKAGTIKVPTAIFVDRSGSMDRAIEVGKKAAALVSGVTTADLFVVVFDTTPMELKAEGKTLTAWEKAFKPVRAGGGTSIGCALHYLQSKKISVEQIVVITDGGENSTPYFSDIYEEYCKTMNVRPHVVIIKMESYDRSFEIMLSQKKIAFDVYSPNAKDNYSLPGLVTLLSRKSKLDLVMEIMDEPLLKRTPFKNL